MTKEQQQVRETLIGILGRFHGSKSLFDNLKVVTFLFFDRTGGDRNCAIRGLTQPGLITIQFPRIFRWGKCFHQLGGELLWQRQFELHSSLSENSAKGGWPKKSVQHIFLFSETPYITEKGVWHALQPYAGQVLWRGAIHCSNKMWKFQRQNLKKITNIWLVE